MTQTLTALLLAHVLADFVFQTNWMVANKHRPAAFVAHGAVVLATMLVVTGNLHPVLLALTFLHMAVDAAKTAFMKWMSARPQPSGKTEKLSAGLGPFLADQAAHLATLALIAALFPGLWAAGLWAGWASLPALMALTAGALAATRAGGFAVGLLMAPWARELEGHGNPGLSDGGQAIGWLERGLIFLLVLNGQPDGIGFLIAAKSVLRFGTVADDRAVSEYVIIGTLASFAWAIAVSFATTSLLSQLPPLGIPAVTP